MTGDCHHGDATASGDGGASCAIMSCGAAASAPASAVDFAIMRAACGAASPPAAVPVNACMILSTTPTATTITAAGMYFLRCCRNDGSSSCGAMMMYLFASL